MALCKATEEEVEGKGQADAPLEENTQLFCYTRAALSGVYYLSLL